MGKRQQTLPAMVTVKELAEFASVVVQTVYDAIERGELHPERSKPYLFSREEARRWTAWRKKQIRPGPKGRTDVK